MKKITLVGAIWCSSCLTMKRIMKSFDDVEVEYLDIDEDDERINELGITDDSIIPIIIYGDKRLVGEHNIDEIEAFLNEK